MLNSRGQKPCSGKNAPAGHAEEPGSPLGALPSYHRKGNLRPETAVRWGQLQWPLADRKAADRIPLFKPTVLKAVISDLCQADWQSL
jgi:hypothetical protein